MRDDDKGSSKDNELFFAGKRNGNSLLVYFQSRLLQESS